MNFIDRYLRKIIAKVHAGAPGEMAAKTINRYSIVVYPLEPYAEWAARIAKLKPDETLLILQTSSQASFLLPQTDTPPHHDEGPLKEIYPVIFDYMLRTWERDKGRWPKDRSYETFKEWFGIMYSDRLFDVSDEPLRHNP